MYNDNYSYGTPFKLSVTKNDYSNIKGNILNAFKKAIRNANGLLWDSAPIRNILPTNIKFYADNILGNNKTHTEKDLNNKELNALRFAIADSAKINGYNNGTIGYDNYFMVNKKGDYIPQSYEDSPLGNMVNTFLSPDYRMSSTIGNAKYYKAPNGDIILIDKHDFNNASNEDRMYMNKPYRIIHELAENYGNPYDVKINLGNPKDWRVNEW